MSVRREAANRVTINCWYQRRCGAVGVDASTCAVPAGAGLGSAEVGVRESSVSQASVKDTQRLASSPGFKLFTQPCPRDRTIFATVWTHHPHPTGSIAPLRDRGEPRPRDFAPRRWVSRSDIRLIRHLDSSALGLVRRWLLIGYFPTHYQPAGGNLTKSGVPANPGPRLGRSTCSRVSSGACCTRCASRAMRVW
jgi:hypothetical protein